MQQGSGATEPEREIAAFRARSGALRHSASMPGAQLPQLLEAAFAELDGAIDAAAAAFGAPSGQPAELQGETSDVERRLLRAMFQNAPVALFLLDRDGTIRRANSRAGELLGAGVGYATGKLLTAFVDLQSRAAVHSQLAAVARTGKRRRISCPLLGKDTMVNVVLALDVIQLAGEPDLVIAAVTMVPGPPAAGSGPAAGGKPAGCRP
jgi:PAS domain S-box-containing protein